MEIFKGYLSWRKSKKKDRSSYINVLREFRNYKANSQLINNKSSVQMVKHLNIKIDTQKLGSGNTFMLDVARALYKRKHFVTNIGF